MYHIKVLLNQKRVTFNNCKITDFNSADDFLKIVVSSYIVTAAMEILKMNTVDDNPGSNDFIQEDDWLKDTDERYDALYALSSKIANTYVDLSMEGLNNGQEDDKVLEYSCLVLSWGLLYLEFCDGIKEGDGNRVLRCWRYLFLLFKSTNRVNYCIEAFTLLAQYHFIFSQRQAHQLLWSRFVNIHGLPARNIPCDLYMEHLNRVCKDVVSHLKANKSKTALLRVGKVVGILDQIISNFNDENLITTTSGKHSVPDASRDVRKVVAVLCEENALKYKPNRCHPSFTTIIRNPLSKIDHENLISWMYVQLNNIIHGF